MACIAMKHNNVLIQENFMYNKMLSTIMIGFTILMFPISNAAYGQEDLQLRAMFPEANAITLYELNFILKDSLNAKSQLKITFPKSFDLSKVKMAGSATINGGFNIEVLDSTVILKRSGLGQTILPRKKIDVKFANVLNPPTPDRVYEVKVEIFNDNIKLLDKKVNVKILARKAE